MKPVTPQTEQTPSNQLRKVVFGGSRGVVTFVRTAIVRSWWRIALVASGVAALVWFLIRVIPKPSRASYPCQRAAFPVASGFVIWLCGVFAIKFGLGRLRRGFSQHKLATAGVGLMALAAILGWTWFSFSDNSLAQTAANAVAPQIDWNYVPPQPNTPVGVARGINPGRVVWAHDPKATRWAGNWRQNSDQWWLDENTDQSRVDAMLDATLTQLTSAQDSAAAWEKIFQHYNSNARALKDRGYQPGEVVAVKINVNNSIKPLKADNMIDASPQMVLAMVRQLVNQAHVRQEAILLYDGRRYIPPYILEKTWKEFPDVRFLQQHAVDPSQPKHPLYGDHRKLESSDWVEGIQYSNGKYKDAKLIPRQVKDATYLVNLAILKSHSYPITAMDGGNEGQTGVTMTGKNHFGSIKGTRELHPAIDTVQEAKTPRSYSPIVDLNSSPNLGGKTILFVLDGLYCGRKWQSYPQHFPNPPFNNRTSPYENPEWPASVLASMDGVALDSVGLDLLFAQTKNNDDETGRPRLLIRANADDYLNEMALADQPPSGVKYIQGGKPVQSLGVHERWDSDETKRYSRNLDPKNGKGIELIYVAAKDIPAPPAGLSNKPDAPAKPVESPKAAAPASASKTTTNSISGTNAPVSYAPDILPGKGLAQHSFFYAGEWDFRKRDQTMFIVRDGNVVWSYSIPMRNAAGRMGEISDATLMPNGNVVYACMYGAGMVTPEKKVVWSYDAPAGTEVHVIQPLDANRVMLVRNGNPAMLMIIDTGTGKTEKEFSLPSGNTNKIHGQFRRVRMTEAGTFLAAHMDNGRVAEYDADGREIWGLEIPSPWSANRLKNGNTLIASNKGFVREVDAAGKTVWELTQKDVPDIRLFSLQEANRLENGNTVISSWCPNAVKNTNDWSKTVQVIEVTPQNEVVWALRSWDNPDLGPATVIQLLDAKSVR